MAANPAKSTSKQSKKGRGHPRLTRPQKRASLRSRTKKNTATPQIEAEPAASRVAVVVEEARRAGLLDGDRTEHVSFRAPKALLEAAQRETGITSPTQLGILALATLAQPDPAADYLKKSFGVLGKGHTLEI